MITITRDGKNYVVIVSRGEEKGVHYFSSEHDVAVYVNNLVYYENHRIKYL